jgi:integrase
LRHTAVALAIASGGHPKQIRELCRHSNITTTMGTYGHLFEMLHDRPAERLGETFLASAAGQIRDTSGTNVVAMAVAEPN